MSSVDLVKQEKQSILRQYSKAENIKGLTQVLTTLIPLAVLWWAVPLSLGVSWWLTAAVTLLISLFDLRVFVLMHECGHGSLFRSQGFNRGFGFLFGVISSIPQYVWSKHHDYHHATNSNWEKYRGPLSILSVDEYAALTTSQQRSYRSARSIAMAPLGGLMYLIFNPRFTWIKGSIELFIHILKMKIALPSISIRMHAAGFKTRYWKSSQEYRHMLWNNVVLLSVWLLMAWLIGPVLFFTVYLVSLSLAGGAGIVLFAVQHNFEHSHATDSEHWDFDVGAIKGTSFLILPNWLNWFTANIAYHHIHHLSSRIPNYNLARCHNQYVHLFSEVTRLKVTQIPRALSFILWDVRAERIISVAMYQQQLKLAGKGSL